MEVWVIQHQLVTVSSVVVGGSNQTGSGCMSFIGGGDNNTASGAHSTIGGGKENTSSNSYSIGS